MNLLEHVLYINLEYRTDRREHTEKEFEKLNHPTDANMNIERIVATKTQHGAVGCSLSHIRCLEYAKSMNWPYVLICEDDITFMNPELFTSKLSEFAKSGIQWDVLVIAGNTAPPFGDATSFCIRTYNVQSTTGYIVQQGYYETLIANFREGVRRLMADPENKREYAIDMYWKRLQQSGNWYTLIPLSVYQYSTYSDVENREVDYKHLMLDLDKKWLFSEQKKKGNMPLHFI